MFMHNRKAIKQYFMILLDGGTCYFKIDYNLSTGSFKNLVINGEAITI